MTTAKVRCEQVVALLDKIIQNNLPYSQLTFYQHIKEGEDRKYIFDFNELVKSGRTCCFMGYLVATPEFKENGGTFKESINYDDKEGVDVMESYTGIPGVAKFVNGHDNKTPQEFKDFMLRNMI